MFESIGPVWDGNEVWLVIAGGATFAAFPVWYATMFSGFYLALLLILVLLIVRVVSFEWREKAESPRWRTFWAWVNTIGIGRRPAPLGHRAREPPPRRPDRRPTSDFAGDFCDLFSGYTVLAGIAVVPAVRAPRRASTSRSARSVTCARAALHTRDAPRSGGRAGRRRLPRLDASSSRTTGTTRASSRPSSRSPSRRSPRSRRSSSCAAAQEQVGVRRDGDHDRGSGRDALREPLSAGDGVGSRLREQPDDRQRLLGPLHADGDDRGRRGSHPGHPPLPGLDVPRLPRPARRGGRRQHRSTWSRGRPAPRSPCGARPAPAAPRAGRCAPCWPPTPRSACSRRCSSSPRRS